MGSMLSDLSFWTLAGSAVVIGITHTILGPDHYMPFVALSRARQWKISKTIRLTLLCGLGHVASSVIIGFVGIIAGVSVGSLEFIESFRGDIAGWLLIIFGAIYLAWALRKAGKRRSHSHAHVHSDGTIHKHHHDHAGDHAHPHVEENLANNSHKPLAAWSLFVIFIFGPCEALIPLFLYPAAQQNWYWCLGVVLAFSLATVGTMLVAVFALTRGLSFLRLPSMERWGQVLAAAIILLCGLAIQVGL